MSCEACPPEQPPLPADFALCGAFLEIVPTETELFIYLANCEAVAGFQFMISVDGEVLTNELEGSGGAASGMTITGGNGIVIGVDIQGVVVIPPGSFVFLTKLVQVQGTTFPAGEYCLIDVLVSDVNGTAIPSFSSCSNFAATCLAPCGEPGSFLDEICEDDPEFMFSETNTTCSESVDFCLSDVVLASCPESCGVCPPAAPPVPPFENCNAFLDIVPTPDELFIYMATCFDVTGFLFSISVD